MQDSNSYSQRLHIITASILAIIGNKRCCLVLLSRFDLFFFMRKMTKLKKFRGILPKSLKTSFFLFFFLCWPSNIMILTQKTLFLSPFHSRDWNKPAKEMQFTQGHSINETNNPVCSFFHFFF